MTKITKLFSKILYFGLILNLLSCSSDNNTLDPNYPFLGTYHALESFYNPQTKNFESYTYDIGVFARLGSTSEITISSFGSNTIYGLDCLVFGEVDGYRINIPLNTCDYDSNTTFEIRGKGELSNDKKYLTFDLDIMRCSGGNCYDEPRVHIQAHRI